MIANCICFPNKNHSPSDVFEGDANTISCHCWYHFPHLSHPHIGICWDQISFHHRAPTTEAMPPLRRGSCGRGLRTPLPGSGEPPALRPVRQGRGREREAILAGGGKKGRWTCTTVLCIYIYLYIIGIYIHMYRYKYILYRHIYIYSYLYIYLCIYIYTY